MWRSWCWSGCRTMNGRGGGGEGRCLLTLSRCCCLKENSVVVQPVEMAAYPTEHSTNEAEEVRDFQLLLRSSWSPAGASNTDSDINNCRFSFFSLQFRWGFFFSETCVGNCSAAHRRASPFVSLFHFINWNFFFFSGNWRADGVVEHSQKFVSLFSFFLLPAVRASRCV